MGRKTRLREVQKRVAEQALCERLRARRRTEPRPGFISTFAEFAPHYRARIELYGRFAIHAPEAWASRVRARSPELRFLDLVRFTFARFPAPQHLERAWTRDLDVGAQADPARQGPAPFELGHPDHCYWYILAVQGKSLFREVTHAYISKRETHYFLNAPSDVATPAQALWYAVAMAANPDVEVALRVSRTRLIACPVAWKFWQDVARFFACNPLPVLEMNDFIDFFQAERDLDQTFEIHGRTVPALRRRMAEWHRMLQSANIFKKDRWVGRSIPDAVYRTEGELGPVTWRMHQITDSHELFREGERMQHCVVAYRGRCMEGLASIWSLSSEDPAGTLHRGLTIEVEDGTVVQCRGFANRSPTESELVIVTRWAGDHGLGLWPHRFY